MSFLRDWHATHPEHIAGQPFRWYVPQIGTLDRLVAELDFKTMAGSQHFWETFNPGDAYWAKFNECFEPGASNELLRVEIQYS